MARRTENWGYKMKSSTLTTIQAIIQADNSVPEEQRNRIIKACKSNQPHRRNLGTLKQVAEEWDCSTKTAAGYVKRFKIDRIEFSQRRHRYDLTQVKAVNLGGSHV